MAPLLASLVPFKLAVPPVLLLARVCPEPRVNFFADTGAPVALPLNLPQTSGTAHLLAATLERVLDGDTFVAQVDLGYRTWITQKFRLRGIDTP